METLELIRDLYRHMEWADASIWTTVLASETAREDEDVIRRMHHFHMPQDAYLRIWNDEPVDYHPGEGLDPEALASRARDTLAAVGAFVTRLTDAVLTGPVALPWIRQVAERLGHEPAPANLCDTLIQVYAHTMHHRGQVAARLRTLGVDPPMVDYLAWVWLGRPKPRWP